MLFANDESAVCRLRSAIPRHMLGLTGMPKFNASWMTIGITMLKETVALERAIFTGAMLRTATKAIRAGLRPLGGKNASSVHALIVPFSILMACLIQTVAEVCFDIAFKTFSGLAGREVIRTPTAS